MKSSFSRLLVASLVAVPVAVALFYLMQNLVTREYRQPESKVTQIDDIIVPQETIEVIKPIPRPEPLDDPQTPPPKAVQVSVTSDDAFTVTNDPPPQAQDPEIHGGTGMSEGEYLPIVKVEPLYPSRAQQRGISGYCIVEYTVTTAGSTRNPRPVDCAPGGLFERASVKAAEKFKYKPRVVNGVAVEVAGVRNRFVFKLQ